MRVTNTKRWNTTKLTAFTILSITLAARIEATQSPTLNLTTIWVVAVMTLAINLITSTGEQR